MRTCRSRTYLMVCLAVPGLSTWGYCQAQAAHLHNRFAHALQADGAQSEGLDAIPAVHVEYKPNNDIPGVNSSPVISSPILCSPDGIPFVSVPEPPDYTTQTVYSLDPKGAHTFSMQSAVGLYDACGKTTGMRRIPLRR